MSEDQYRIEYSIQRKRPADEDFVEIGFGSSNAKSSVGAALYAVQSDVQNNLWETTPSMPEPAEIEVGN